MTDTPRPADRAPTPGASPSDARATPTTSRVRLRGLVPLVGHRRPPGPGRRALGRGPCSWSGSLVLSIFLHELGHFLAAKQAGMKVTEFFIGFGPRLWSFRRGETEYGVKAIPAGAYVRIVGMNNLEEVDAGRRGPHLPREGLLEAAAGGAGRPVHELRSSPSSCSLAVGRHLRTGPPRPLDGPRGDARGAPPRPPGCSRATGSCRAGRQSDHRLRQHSATSSTATPASPSTWSSSATAPADPARHARVGARRGRRRGPVARCRPATASRASTVKPVTYVPGGRRSSSAPPRRARPPSPSSAGRPHLRGRWRGDPGRPARRRGPRASSASSQTVPQRAPRSAGGDQRRPAPGSRTWRSRPSAASGRFFSPSGFEPLRRSGVHAPARRTRPSSGRTRAQQDAGIEPIDAGHRRCRCGSSSVGRRAALRLHRRRRPARFAGRRRSASSPCSCCCAMVNLFLGLINLLPAACPSTAATPPSPPTRPSGAASPGTPTGPTWPSSCRWPTR